MHMHSSLTHSIITLLHSAENEKDSEHGWAKVRDSYKEVYMLQQMYQLPGLEN
jgi:hypothetical protein